MKVILTVGDVVWNGEDGGEGSKDGRGIRYSIVVENVKEATEGSDISGCWCPPEAVDFLRYIGIVVIEEPFFTSGYTACGCTFSFHRDLSAHIEVSRRIYTGEQGGNQWGKAFLERWDKE